MDTLAILLVLGLGAYALYNKSGGTASAITFQLSPDIQWSAGQLENAAQFCYNLGGNPSVGNRSCVIPWPAIAAKQPAGTTFEDFLARVPYDPQIQSGVATWNAASRTYTFLPGYNFISGMSTY